MGLGVKRFFIRRQIFFGGGQKGDKRRRAARRLKEGGACISTLDNSPRNPAQCDALGRRAREAMPDSRAEVSGAQGPQAREAPANKGGVIWWSKAK